MIFYRAMPIEADYVRDGDYITPSRRFAIEHAITSSIYHGEDYGVYRVFLIDKEYIEASNPGEYLYSGKDKKARLVGIAKYDNFTAASEFKKVSSMRFENLLKLSKWLWSNGFYKESSLVKKMNGFKKHAASPQEIERLKEWVSKNESELSFDELFDGKLRIVIPFNTKEQRSLVEIISFLKNNSWSPAGGNNFFDVKKVRQKLRRLETGEEYEEEVEVAELKVSKNEERIIPSGPRKGEKILTSSTSTISKVLTNPKNNAPEWMSKWWQQKQAEYSKNYNWKQIESVFEEGELSSEHSIIISRSPIDVLRMSDHENISSCHAEGNSYFECAVSESRGNGLVAYLVETDDLNRLLTPHDPWGWDPETGKGPEKKEIGDLDDQEVFEDLQRDVEGIVPKSRIRLRKYVNTEMDYEFAVPEHRTYGPSLPGFKDLVRNWAWEQQKYLFDFEDDEVDLSLSDLEMHGGSYRDTSDGEILNSFFNEGGIDSRFYGNAETVSDNEESVFDMWAAEIDEINQRAWAELKHVSFNAEVDVFDDNQPYVSTWASIECEIPLSGWDEVNIEDNVASTNSDFNDIPFGWRWSPEIKEFKNILEHDYGEDIEDLDVSEENKTLTYRINFSCEDCTNPDDVNNWLEYTIKSDIDAKYIEYLEKVRKKLISEGYIGEIEFDRVGERLSSMSFQHFDVLGGDEDDYSGEVWVYSKPNSIPLDLKIPNIIMSDISGFDKNTISNIFNADKRPGSLYVLKDEALIAINSLNNIIKESYEFSKKQLHFPFYKEENKESLNFSKAIDNLEVGIYIYNQEITELNIKIVLKVEDSEEDLLFLEKFIEAIEQNLPTIIIPIKQSLIDKIKTASSQANETSRAFLGGEQAMPIIQNLKGFGQPDVVRLALWIEQNWNNFSKAEKEVAYFNYLLPTQRDGDYVHKDELDAPRFWDSYMQKRPDTDISYRWTGPSIKDVMPYTDLSAPIGEGLPDEEAYVRDRLVPLLAWFKINGFKKEAEAISELTNHPSSFKKQADHPLFSPEYMIDTSEYPYYGESEYFPDIEDNIKSEDLYYGQNVLWIGTPGKMIKADPNYVYPIEGNIFYPEKINDVVNKIVNSDERVMFYAPYGIATKININDISESIQYGGGTNQYSPEVLTTGDEELDEYLEDPEGFFSYYDLDDKDEYEEYLKEKDRIDNEIKDAIKNESGDIGKIMVQIRDGNHRAFGAIAAGEPYIWVAIAENQLQDIKHGIGKDSEDIGSRLASNNDEVIKKIASNDKYIVAATLFEEARNQGASGIRAVYHVILNRAKHGRKGGILSEICLEKGAFSCWIGKGPFDKDYDKVTGKDLYMWKNIIPKIMNSPGNDITYGSTNYYKGKDPDWVGPCWIYRTKIGDHTFGIDMSYGITPEALPNDVKEEYKKSGKNLVTCQPQVGKEKTWVPANFKIEEAHASVDKTLSNYADDVASNQKYIHFTNEDDAEKILESKSLWKSSIIVDAVYAAPVGGLWIPGVQLTRLGRVQDRNVAILFETEELPSIAFPEEIIWNDVQEISIKNPKIISMEEARSLLDGSQVVYDKKLDFETVNIKTKLRPNGPLNDL